MIRLKSIIIKGFKEEGRNVKLDFAENSVTVIYGENGSGKTTFLKILDAIFNKNEDYLIEQNVSEINLFYEYKTDGIEQRKLIITIEQNNVVWGENIQEITKTTSILFGVNRGVISDFSSFDIEAKDVQRILSRVKNEFRHSSRNDHRYIDSARVTDDLEYLLFKLSKGYEKNFIESGQFKQNHISVDQISIAEIENAIIREYRAGQRATSDKVKNAFFNTISSAVDIEMEKGTFDLPLDFDKRVNKKREVLLSIVEKLDKSSLQQKLLVFLGGNEAGTNTTESKIFRALLVNILEKVEEESVELKSISQLISVFNSHLYRNKKLVVTDDETYIELSKEKHHKLDKLSSGERHLLTFLTLFLIIARNRDFFIIDEPEISLNMEWQRQLLPLLSELSPSSQIIVATHSPSISNRNSNVLVELI